MEGGQLRAQRRLVSEPAGQPAQQTRDLRARLDEPEDVVDQQQDVLPGVVAEVLRHRQGGVPYAKPRPGLLVHLAEDHHAAVQDAGSLYLSEEFLGLS